MLQEVVNLFKQKNHSLVESEIFPGKDIPYWQSTVVDSEANPLASGFAEDINQARKISISEYLERTHFKGLRFASAETQLSWGLDKHPSCCGFAGGYNQTNTEHRSLREAVERWVMSLWIDDGFYIPEVDSAKVAKILDPTSKFLASHFDSILFFEKRVEIVSYGKKQSIVVAQTMGLKDGGIFPGSSAQIASGHYWQHALLESFRHLYGHKNNPPSNLFPDNKVHFFAKNAKLALEQIKKAQKLDWPEPKIELQKTIELFPQQFYISRTILAGWTNWSLGPLERFLY